jgi:HK97 family phage major capsid protein
MNAVRKQLMLRGLAAKVFGPSSIPGRTLVLPLQSEITTNTEISVIQTPEFGAAPQVQTQFTSLTLTPVKYMVKIGVSKEMLEDGITDLLEYHAELAGYEFADNEEALIVSALDTASGNASHNVANSNATIAITDITQARRYLRADNYNPTHMIVGNEVEDDLLNIDTFVEADKSGVNNPTNGSVLGKIFGMKVLVSNNVSAKLAYVIDANHAFVIAEKRPLTIERYSDFSRDTSFVVVSQRIAISALRDNAVSEITTT